MALSIEFSSNGNDKYKIDKYVSISIVISDKDASGSN